MTLYIASIGSAALAVVMVMFQANRASKAVGLAAIAVSIVCMRGAMHIEDPDDMRAVREWRAMCSQYASRSERVAREWGDYRPSLRETSQQAFTLDISMEASCTDKPVGILHCVPGFVVPYEDVFPSRAAARAQSIRTGTCYERDY